MRWVCAGGGGVVLRRPIGGGWIELKGGGGN